MADDNNVNNKEIQRDRNRKTLGLGFVALALLFLIGVAWSAHHVLERKFVSGTRTYYAYRSMPHPGMMDPGFAGWFDMSYSMVRQPVSGAITKISGNELTLTANNGVTETVTLDADTTISKSGSTIKLSDLKTGDNISVNGFKTGVNQIEARTITVQ